MRNFSKAPHPILFAKIQYFFDDSTNIYIYLFIFFTFRQPPAGVPRKKKAPAETTESKKGVKILILRKFRHSFLLVLYSVKFRSYPKRNTAEFSSQKAGRLPFIQPVRDRPFFTPTNSTHAEKGIFSPESRTDPSSRLHHAI